VIANLNFVGELGALLGFHVKAAGTELEPVVVGIVGFEGRVELGTGIDDETQSLGGRVVRRKEAKPCE
jgi:hypothetical protein